MRCKGRYVSDTLYVGRFPFLTAEGEVAKIYYHVPLYCPNEPLVDCILCRECSAKKDKLEKASIVRNRLISATHPSVLHGTVDDSIPEWSHIKDGAWFKSKLQSGFKIEAMVKKVALDEKKVYALLESFKGSADSFKKLCENYPDSTKTELSKFLISFNKKHKKQIQKTVYLVKNSDSSVEVCEIEVVLIKLSALEYYYNKNNSKLYSLDFNYVGKYDIVNETIVEIPDSDTD